MDSALDFYPEPVGSSPIGAVKLLKHTPCRSTLVPRSRMFFSCFQNDENILEPKQKHYYKGPFIIYGQGVARDFEGGHFFGKSPMRGPLIFGKHFL